MTLTRADLRGKSRVMHADSSTAAMWIYTFEGFPRLGIHDTYVRKTRASTRTVTVDDKPVRDLDAALAVLNGEMTLEEAAMSDAPAPVAQAAPKKFSLASQIAEVKRELGQRAEVYPRLVSSRGMREAEASMKIALMEAVKRTLEWLQANEARIKAPPGAAELDLRGLLAQALAEAPAVDAEALPNHWTVVARGLGIGEAA